MVKNSEEKIPLTQSPSITQETKARFNELLNEALSREKLTQPQVFNRSRDVTVNRQSDVAPRIIPRKKPPAKLSEVVEHAEHFDVSSIYSSEESSDGRRVKRQVIAEVHSSHSRLLLSSSEDDVLSDKKEKKKKKKSRFKQVIESAELIKEEEGQQNLSFQSDEVVERSSSRLSNRSYIIETPRFPVENLTLLTQNTQIHDSSSWTKDDSPSRSSNKSYIIEIPTLPVESPVSTPPVLPKIKTPVPLPRRKSLKSIPKTDEDDVYLKQDRHAFSKEVRKEKNETIITIHDSASQETDDDRDFSKRAAVINLQDSTSPYTGGDDVDIPLSVRKQKRKRKRRIRSKSREEVELQEFSAKDDIDKDTSLLEDVRSDIREDKPAYSPGERIVGVTIHGVDCPIVDCLVFHPVVRLYIVDTTTGEYYSKSDPQRSVCYYGENTQYVQPIMTHPFDFKKHGSVTPQWEECLLLNESFAHLLKQSTLMLFELCDFVSAPVACTRFRTMGHAAGWHIIAWAFLRPVGARGTLNVTARLRLQLYKPTKLPKSLRPLTPAVYEWWGTAKRKKYSGSLYVTVSAIDPPSTPVSPRLRSRLALQAEEGSVASVKSASAVNSDCELDNKEQQDDNMAETVVWTRLAAQSCKIPNTRFCSLPVDGSMCLQFSDNGLWLACARQDIQVFSVPQFQHTTTLTGHQGLVYCLRWNADSKVLLSASADSTVCIWRPKHHKTPLLQMLAHPTFVYCAHFISTPGYCTVVTGSCDGVVRLWQGETHSTYQLTQELAGHSGFVTSITVTMDGVRVISGDSNGSLRIYEVEEGSLCRGREFRVRDIRGTIISNIVTHPGGHRLLVHSRDGAVRSVDVATGAVIQTFKSCLNGRVQTGICVSACGGLVFVCGEDGTLTAWDGHTGALRAVYCGLLPPGSAAVHYHPHEHMLALASLLQPPVFILAFDRNATGEDIGLSIVRNETTATEVIEKIKSLKNQNKWPSLSKVVQSSSRNTQTVKDQKGKKRKGVEKTETTEKELSTNWPSLPQLESLQMTLEDKDLRLLEIIRKMDNMILAAKQSSQS